MSKRGFLRTAFGGGAGALLLANCRGKADAETAEHFEINLTPAEWRARLTPAQYAVLRDHSTERSGSSPLDHEFRKGIYACAGCKLPVYSSSTKFDSGTGCQAFLRRSRVPSAPARTAG